MEPTHPASPKVFRYIDLFAGAGGLSEGFIQQGFQPVAHVEWDEAACNTLRTRLAYYHLRNKGQLERYEAYLRGDTPRAAFYASIEAEAPGLLSSVICEKIHADTRQSIFERIDQHRQGQDIDLIVGGPPCQAYSVAGRGRAGQQEIEEGVSRKEILETQDDRNYLYREYAAFLRQYRPKMFVFENVVGLLSSNNGRHLLDLWKSIRSEGYELDIQRFDATWFGVLQQRPRLIIIGWRTDIKELPLGYPRFEQADTKGARVQDLLADLPVLQPGEGGIRSGHYTAEPGSYLVETYLRPVDWTLLTYHTARPHIDRDRAIYRLCINAWNQDRRRLLYNELPPELITHRNTKTHLDRFKVVAAELPHSHTVVAHINKDGHYYIHPDPAQARSLTVREVARIQTFPDTYFFEGASDSGSRTAGFRQVGNAVPPLMAKVLAGGIRQALEGCGDFVPRSSTALRLDNATESRVWKARLIRPERAQFELALT